MATPLLATKLYVPKPRPELVLRPQLIERLNEGLHHKLTVISAPAGFGKTTLVNEWVTTSDRQVAWLSLDESDGDLTVFLNYFIAALNQAERSSEDIGEGALSMLQSPQPPAVTEILTGLINELAAIPTQTILVLDDYHRIQAQPIHDALAFLLEHLPEQLHLVIVTRQDPQIPLAKLRAQDQLTELRAADLRFSTSEAAEFLDQVMRLKLTPDDVALLESRTEGWIAGLQLAAISMQGIEDTAGFIESFTGSHHFVLDYLIEEVLNNQTEEVQTFLLQTSILDRMTGALCDAITGQHDGQATLEILEHANLFIIPLDEERKWYRYHHLFADLLRLRLRRSDIEQVPDLLQRASEWHEEEGLIDEAIDYALRAEDYERTAQIIGNHIDEIWQRGQHAKLRRWLAALPELLLESKAELGLFHAWYLFARGQPDAAERTLQTAEKLIDTEGKLSGRAAAIRAFMASFKGDVPGMIQSAQEALEKLPEEDSVWRSSMAITLGDAHGFTGDMAKAFEARSEALEACKATGNSYFTLIASMKLAITLREQGRLQEVIELCQHYFQFANESGVPHTAGVGWLLAVWGETLAELNDLDVAILKTEQGFSIAEPGGDLGMLGWSYLCLIRVYFSQGNINEADKAVQKMQTVAGQYEVPPWVRNRMAAWQARIWLAQGKLADAERWMEERKPEQAVLPQQADYFLLIEYVVIVRVLLAQEKADEASRWLEQLLTAAEANSRTTLVIELLLLQALAFQAKDDIDEALSTLEQALTLAEPRGFVRVFVDEGPAIAQLLYEAARREIVSDYAQRLLAAFPTPEGEPVDSKHTQMADFDLIEPLSEREGDVLELMAEGLTNQEIGTRLFLSLNTVKVHARNIYGKLGVNNRTQAVTKAQGLGILQQT
ncbi:MAG: hypothetical protein HND51_00090 [Chloroflexi bacterium]|nr:hypothetical protein [Chloroflexota bacterium]NOH10021.1 hypothetical protein [Chloroflexota bacterium]